MKVATLVLALLGLTAGPGCSFELYRQSPDGSGPDAVVPVSDQALKVDGPKTDGSDGGQDDGLAPPDKGVPLDNALTDKAPVADQKVPDQTVDQTSDQTVDQKVPDQTVDQTSDQTVDQKVPDQTVDQKVPGQTVDQTVPDQTVDQPVPDQTVDQPVPDQTVDQPVPDQTVPDQLVCPPGSVLDETMGSSTGWVQMAGSSQAQILATQIYIPLNQYGSVLHSNPAGLVCVPPGKGLDVTLTYTCASGTVSIGLYDVYCTASTCNTKTAVKYCSFSCSSSSEVTNTCTVTAQEAGGRWIYAARASRGASGGSTAYFWHLTLAVP